MKLPVLDLAEFMSILSQVKEHGTADHAEGECDYCDWIRSARSLEIMEALFSNKLNNEILIFLYFGIQLGRNQVLQEGLERSFPQHDR
jgi:hypothetical protein